MMASCASRSAVTETTAGKRLPILADIGQLVDVFDPARGFEHQRLESRGNRGAELETQRGGARDHFLRIRNVGRRDRVHDFGGRVAQHPLGADVEDLDDALGVGGDAREVGAVEDRPLQRPRLDQSLSVAPVRVNINRFGDVCVDCQCVLGSVLLRSGRRRRELFCLSVFVRVSAQLSLIEHDKPRLVCRTTVGKPEPFVIVDSRSAFGSPAIIGRAPRNRRVTAQKRRQLRQFPLLATCSIEYPPGLGCLVHGGHCDIELTPQAQDVKSVQRKGPVARANLSNDLEILWSGREDLNLRPLGPEPSQEVLGLRGNTLSLS